YSFPDDAHPVGGLIFDAKGNLYGNTTGGGSDDAGTVFELTPTSSGTWNATVLYGFTNTPDGLAPSGDLIFDAAGNIYGTTIAGGAKGGGTVFKLTPSKGVWTESVLHSFNGPTDGATPFAGVTMDGKGNLYGAAQYVLFELMPTSSGWKDVTIHDFKNSQDENALSDSRLILDKQGNLYGTAYFGGNGCNSPGCGFAFRFTPQSEGSWKESLLRTFESADDGSQPRAGMIFDG